jgi:hypothetical protein
VRLDSDVPDIEETAIFSLKVRMFLHIGTSKASRTRADRHCKTERQDSYRAIYEHRKGTGFIAENSARRLFTDSALIADSNT